jgi:hypothetical protein
MAPVISGCPLIHVGNCGSLLQLPFHGGDHFIGGVEGAECATSLEVLRRFGQAGVDDPALGGTTKALLFLTVTVISQGLAPSA